MRRTCTPHHIGVNVQNIPAALEFYKDTLGFSEVRQWTPGERQGRIDGLTEVPDIDIEATDARVVYLETDKIFLELVEYQYPTEQTLIDSLKTNAIGRSHVCFTVKGIGRLYDNLASEYEFLSRPVMSSSGGLMVKCLDPAGNILEFYEPRESLGGGENSRVIGVDHVGMNVHNMDRGVEFYKTVLGWPVERRYKPTASVDPFVSNLDPEEAVTEIAFLDGETCEVELLEYPDAEFPDFPEYAVGKFHLGVEVTDVSRWYDRLQSEIEFLGEPQSSTTGTTVVKCHDGNGYTIEFIDTGEWLQ